jgi:hypothetical protein
MFCLTSKAAFLDGRFFACAAEAGFRSRRHVAHFVFFAPRRDITVLREAVLPPHYPAFFSGTFASGGKGEKWQGGDPPREVLRLFSR